MKTTINASARIRVTATAIAKPVRTITAKTGQEQTAEKTVRIKGSKS